MSPDSNGLSDTDAVVINRDDVSNYNPEQILPESPKTIQKIRGWLQPTSYDLDSGEYRKHLTSHVAGTGVWLTSSNTYQEWLYGDEHGMLWIKGIPGSGKSVLAAKLTDELSQFHPGAPVLYFFFRQIIDANHEPVALLRDWLGQVLNYSPPLQKKLKGYMDSKRSLSSMSMEDLWRDLRMAFAGLPGRVFCVADALDEMDGGNEAFLQALAALGQWKPGKVKVLITSRLEPSVEGPLRKAKCLQIRLQENLVDIDISSYVRQRLEATSFSPSNQDLIKEAVPGRANGLFLYAKLAMDAFLDPGADIKEVLRVLPADLNDMYTNLLREHAHRSGVPDDIQLLILRWVTHATRPLRLLEIAEMINVTYREEIERDLRSTKDLVRAACGPLLEILPDETVCVVHHSFTEYLKGSTRSDDSSGYPILQLGSTHASLGLACLRYMQAGCLDQNKTTQKPQTEDFDSDFEDYDSYPISKRLKQEEVQMRLKYPFLEYAVANWHIHITRSAAAGHDQTKVNTALRKFFDNKQRTAAWLKLDWPGGEGASKGVTQLHIAARTGLSAYAKALLNSEGVDSGVCDVHGKTPLWWAATCGRADVIRLLVEVGADPDKDESVSGLKPLHKAASNNHFEAAKVLLEAGVDPLTEKTREYPGNWCGNAPRSTGHTPLMYTCHNGHVETVEVFLPFLKDIDIVHRALAWAAERGHSKVVERVLKHPGVNVNAKVRGDTPLFLACRSSDVKTITLLLNAGANPAILCAGCDDEFAGIGGRYYSAAEHENATRGFTALHNLCGSGSRRHYYQNGTIEPEALQGLFSLLIQAGADVNQRDASGSTPLHGAIGNPLLVRLLLDAGADANAVSDGGDTPIHKVTSLETMRLLIENGQADMDKPLERDGRTPLLCMLNTCNTEIILKFLEYGPNCNVTDKDGNGALHITLKERSTTPAILKALLRAGADPNLRNRSGQTPLHVIKHDNLKNGELLDIMLQAGADINAKSNNGATPLFRRFSDSSYGYGEETHQDFKILMDRGASLTTRDSKGRTLLHEAIFHHRGQESFTSSYNRARSTRFDFLLDLGLDPQDVDYSGNTLLHELAFRSGNHDSYFGPKFLPLWKQLLALDLDLDRGNGLGRTPLHILCSNHNRWDSMKIGETLPIDFVIQSTENINATDHNGITPLHLAATVSEANTKKLLDAGADPTVSSFEGLTPLHLAARSRQSNIVGLLLDALRTRNQQAETSSNFGSHPAGALVPGIALSPRQHGKPINRINAIDDDGYTPLFYACRSGRPETVAILLQAGADVNVRTFVACAEFEDEQDLWRNHCYEADPGANGAAGGLKLRDKSRPAFLTGSGCSHDPGLDPNQDTARLEEILDMLVQKDADVSQLDHGMYGHWNSPGAINIAVKNRRDYTAACLMKIRDRKPANDKVYKSTMELFVEHSRQYRQKSIANALREFKHIKQGESNWELFRSMMLRREYDMIEELFHVGVDFLTGKDSSHMSTIVKHGFASLLERIGRLESEAKFKEGTGHAAGNKTQPGLGYCTKYLKGVEGSENHPTPFLLQAVQRELPNMDVIRLLVEKFGVDIDELHYTREYLDGEYGVVPTNSALHSLAEGSNWWHVALAIPYFVDRAANIEIRNNKGQTPLQIALRGEGYVQPFHKNAARALIAAGANVNAVDGKGRSCLGYAGSDVEMIRLLIAHGAIVKADALFAAIDARQVDVLEALLSAGADPNMRRQRRSKPPTKKAARQRGRISLWNNDGGMEEHQWYPVHYAATKHRAGYSDPAEVKKHAKESAVKLVETLLAHGADPFAKFWKRLNPYQLPEDSESGDECDIDEENRTGDEEKKDRNPTLSPPSTVTVGAAPATSSSSEVPKGYEERTILHELLSEGDIVHPFLNLPDLDPNHRDPKGQTVLHRACSGVPGPDAPIDALSGDKWDSKNMTTPSLLNHLLSLGADPQARDNAGQNALHHMLSVVGFGHRINSSTIRVSLTQLAKAHPVLLSQRDNDGNLPLHLALRRALPKLNVIAAENVLSCGADPFATDKDGNTALHILALRLFDTPKLRALFQKLLDKGLDINARNNRGETPAFSFYKRFDDRLAGGCYMDPKNVNYKAAIALFENAGADFQAKDNKGRGLLHVAAKGGVSKFKGLLKKELDPLMEDVGRQTPLDVAAACGDKDILGLFEKMEDGGKVIGGLDSDSDEV